MGIWTKRILLAAGLILNLGVALGLLCAAYGGKVAPEVSTLPALFSMTFPFWFGGAVALVIADLLLRQRWLAAVPAIALACSLGPIASYAPVNLVKKKVSDQDSAKVFTLLTFNTAALVDIEREQRRAAGTLTTDSSPNKIADYIIHSGADIVLTQEFVDVKENLYLGFSQRMVDTLNTVYPHRLFAEGPRGTYGEHRCMIFSKFPMRRVALPEANGFSEWSAAIIDIRGMETLVVDVHLQSIGLSRQDKDLYLELTEGEGSKGKVLAARNTLFSKVSLAMRYRARQARTLRHAIDSIGVPNVIVAGDFNDIPGCYAIRQIAGDDFRNAFNDAANGPMITFHSDRFYFHIDHILYRGDMEAIDCGRGDCPESDHYPVLATFLMK